MGKSASAVAVLLATSFFGSLLALVLVGRNPLVGSSNLAPTESLAEEVRAGPVALPGASPSPSRAAASEFPAPVLPAAEARPPASTETDPATGDRPDQERESEDDLIEPPPSPTSEPAEDVVGKISGESSEPPKGEKKGTGPPKEKAEGGDDGPEGAKGGPRDGPTEEAGGPGKGPKGENGKGPGNGGTESSGKGKGKP